MKQIQLVIIKKSLRAIFHKVMKVFNKVESISLILDGTSYPPNDLNIFFKRIVFIPSGVEE